MKFTLAEIRRMDEPLARLSKMALPAPIAYWLARDIKTLSDAIVTVKSQTDALIVKYGEPAKDASGTLVPGQFSLDPTSSKFVEWRNEMAVLMAIEEDYNVHPIELNSLIAGDLQECPNCKTATSVRKPINITAEDMLALGNLIKE